jgi:hypothetical protein
LSVYDNREINDDEEEVSVILKEFTANHNIIPTTRNAKNALNHEGIFLFVIAKEITNNENPIIAMVAFGIKDNNHFIKF